MSTTAKALIITWVIVGAFIVGGVGFYLGRMTVPQPKLPSFPQGQQQQGQLNQQPGFQGGQGQFQQPSGFPQPSGQQQGQFPPPGGGQLPQNQPR